MFCGDRIRRPNRGSVPGAVHHRGVPRRCPPARRLTPPGGLGTARCRCAQSSVRSIRPLDVRVAGPRAFLPARPPAPCGHQNETPGDVRRSDLRSV